MKWMRMLLAFSSLFLLVGCQSQEVPSSSPADLAARAEQALPQISGTISVKGLSKPVEILRDNWGIPHIFAETTEDLFFAQGFVAAQDRMWQLDMWRRTGEGRMAEVLGPSAIDRDKFARLLRYRGDWEAEYRSYHPEGRKIIESFVRGINAAIEQTSDRLPIEFQTMGTKPDPWTPETVVLRIAGYIMTRNASSEVQRARMVKILGPEKTAELAPLNPAKKIEVPEGLNLADIDERILTLMRSADSAINFKPVESNNWVVDGTKTETGKPLLANDPHRNIDHPSLRYIVHLVGPGWNVIGSGEPALPGISMGHNERIAFGLTILGIDQQDLYVEETDPQNPDRYRYRDEWTDMRVEKEQIKVKGQAPVEVHLKFTRHGPVIHEDRQNNRAYALRWVGSEPGTTGYLGALAVNQAKNWEEFKKGMEQWKLPSHNIVYGDVDGNIGYHGAGMTPIRRGWDGLLPVPGNSGKYEWDGFLQMAQLPNYSNPPQHFISTANHNVIPPGYKHALGYELGSSYRQDRIVEVLRGQSKFAIADFQKLQHDATSLPARQLVPLLRGVKTENPELRHAIDTLLSWDYWVGKDSPAAAIYELWFMKLQPSVYKPRVPEEVWELVQGRYSTDRVIEWLKKADAARNQILLKSLEEAIAELKRLMGSDMKQWRWGRVHVVEFNHPLAYSDELKSLLNPKGVERDGDGYTVGNTSNPSPNSFKQRGGASYRHIMDTADWDRSVATNVPGQSGQPRSPHYSDLVDYWAQNKYFPLLYSRSKIEQNTKNKLVLKPATSSTSYY